MRVRSMPRAWNGTSRSCSAPGLLLVETMIEVLSSPVGGTSWLPMIKKRVELSGRSSIFSASLVSPYSWAAMSPAIAALFHSLFTRLAASALLDTATRSTFG
ncbi:hypothetical protein D3C81_1570390 [compost metagenome]